jgi:hypothetical protein
MGLRAYLQQFGNNIGNVTPMRRQCGRAVIVTFFTRIEGLFTSFQRVTNATPLADVPDSKSGGTDRALQCREGGGRDRLRVKSDGERMAVGLGGAVLIPPAVRHRAARRMTILNVVVPPFDPADEWFD